MHSKFDPTGVRTHDLQIMTVHYLFTVGIAFLFQSIYNIQLRNICYMPFLIYFHGKSKAILQHALKLSFMPILWTENWRCAQFLCCYAILQSSNSTASKQYTTPQEVNCNGQQDPYIIYGMSQMLSPFPFILYAYWRFTDAFVSLSQHICFTSFHLCQYYENYALREDALLVIISPHTANCLKASARFLPPKTSRNLELIMRQSATVLIFHVS